MKKNMIALAVAGALVAPVAMAEVTISGGLQAELVQIGGGDDSPNGLYAADAWQANNVTSAGENQGNYGFLKFSATEDLGGGMKALAVYNMNINVGDGLGAPVSGSAPGGREAFVGLSGGFGTVLAGTLATPYGQNRTIDPFLATSFQARGNGGMSRDLNNSYAGNALAYANGFMGGMVKLTAAVVMDEDQKGTTDKTTAKHGKSFAVDLAPMSGLTVTLAYIDISKFAEGADKKKATKLAAKYATGAFSVAAQVEMLDKGFDTEAAATADKHNVTYLTGTFNIDDANSVSVSYGSTDKKAFNEDAATADSEGYMAVGFKHAFSKNTSAMVGYRQTTSVNGVDGKDEKAAGVGMRVAF